MSKVPLIQTQYQLVVASIPALDDKQLVQPAVVSHIKAPTGFRLHSFTPLKETVLVGQSHKVLLVFENAVMVEVDQVEAPPPPSSDDVPPSTPEVPPIASADEQIVSPAEESSPPDVENIPAPNDQAASA